MGRLPNETSNRLGHKNIRAIGGRCILHLSEFYQRVLVYKDHFDDRFDLCFAGLGAYWP